MNPSLESKTRRALPLATLVAIVSIVGALSYAATDRKEAETLANPIEQRREMIELLRSIDRRLATLEDRLVALPPK